MDWAEFEKATKHIDRLGIAIQEFAEALRAAMEWLADKFILDFSGFAEAAELTRKSLEARKRRRKHFAEWAQGEEQRRAAKIRQYERVEIRPSGRNYSRTLRRAFKPPSRVSKQEKAGNGDEQRKGCFNPLLFQND